MIHIGSARTILFHPKTITVLYFTGLVIGVLFYRHVTIDFIHHDIHGAGQWIRIFGITGEFHSTGAGGSIRLFHRGKIGKETLFPVPGLTLLSVNSDFHFCHCFVPPYNLNFRPVGQYYINTGSRILSTIILKIFLVYILSINHRVIPHV